VEEWGQAQTVKPGTLILHSRADDVVAFEDSLDLISKSGLPASAMIEVGQDHRLADPEPLEALLRAVGGLC
jgi:dipeptidyl aminopeptidase/acylaminoacyl peptidase